MIESSKKLIDLKLDLQTGRLTKLLRRMIKETNSFNIVHVGAHDGFYYDPIYDFVKEESSKINILLVEPQDFLATKLETTYNFHNQKTIVADVVSDGTTKDFYTLKEEYYKDYDYDWMPLEVPEYVYPSAIASLSENVFKNNFDLSFNNKEVSFENAVNINSKSTITLPSLINKYQWDPSVDILLLSVEGEEANILQANDWNTFLPDMIIFSDHHMTESTKADLITLLQSFGYECYPFMALLSSIFVIKKTLLED
jgi:hypothetical protein